MNAPAPAGAVGLADVQRLLSLFAQGLAGRYLHLRPAGLLGPDAPAGPFALREARRIGLVADGSALVLPETIADFPVARHNYGAYRVAVLHQLGYLENGSFAFSLDAARARIPGLPAEAAEQGAGDGAAHGAAHGTARTGLRSGASDPRAASSDPRSVPSDLERFLALWPTPALMRRLFETLEAMRIDHAVRRRYPGARADLERVLAHALGTRPPLQPLAPLAALLEGLARRSLGAPREALLSEDATGLLAGLLDAAQRVASDTADVHDSAAAAVECLRLLARAGLARRAPGDLALEDLAGPGAEEPAPGNGDAPGIPDGDASGDPDAPPIDDDAGIEAIAFRGDVDLAVLQRGLKAAGIVAAMEGAGLVVPDGAPQEDEEAPRGQSAPAVTVRRSAESDDGATRTFLYDEWDFHAQAYLKGWCRLHEQRLLGDDHGFIRTVRDRHGELMQRIKRQFRAIRPEARQRVRRVSDGEELELDGIIDTVIDRRAGHATDERLYMRRDRALRDVAAAFLLDMSASTDIPVPDKDAPPPAPEPAPPAGEEDSPYLWTVAVAQDDGDRTPVRRVIDVGRESMALMCEALQTLGDRYAIYGFSGYGRDHVEFYVAKEFDDRLSARTWAAIGAMEPRKSTRMGPAIRHALAKLERQPTRMKVLVIVSDGFPQDCDYGPDRNDDEYGVQDTARALLEASRAGVETFLVTIDPTGHDYLRRMCADERYMIIDEVADLPEALTKVYRALTA